MWTSVNSFKTLTVYSIDGYYAKLRNITKISLLTSQYTDVFNPEAITIRYTIFKMTCPLAKHIALTYSTVIFRHSVNLPFQLEFFKIFTWKKKKRRRRTRRRRRRRRRRKRRRRKICKVKTAKSYLKSLAVMLQFNSTEER